VYGAGRSPFGEEFGDYSTKLKDANGKPVYLGFTTGVARRGRETLFHGLQDGARWIQLPDFKNEIKKTYL